MVTTMKAHAVRELRRDMGLSQSEFARLVGVAPNTVARWERGELGMRPTTARLIELLTAKKRKRA
jgi:DNA-binding transcriptional regulator YiaG